MGHAAGGLTFATQRWDVDAREMHYRVCNEERAVLPYAPEAVDVRRLCERPVRDRQAGQGEGK